jgi:hypothetical protein
MIGKRFSSDDEVLGRLRRLQRLINSFRAGFIPPADDTSDIENLFQRDVVEEKTDDYVLDEDDYGKTLMMNAAGAKTFTLPAVTADELGLFVTLVKRGAGKVTIQTGGADKIQDSGAGGTLYNDLAEETFAIVKLKVIAAATWIIEFFTGSGWRTS